MTSAVAETSRPQIGALTGIRLFAAAWVVVEHLRDQLFALLPFSRHFAAEVRSGYLGVEVFFVLSGFIISYNYADRLHHFSRRTYARFLQLRFARLYPVQLATLLVALILVIGASTLHLNLNTGARYNVLTFVMNGLMLQHVAPSRAWNPPAWSICCEAGAYLAFPLLAYVVTRVKSRLTALAGALAGMAFTLVLLIGVPQVNGSLWSGWVRIAGEFTAGCFLWVLWRQIKSFNRMWDVAAVAGVAGAVVIVAAVTDPGGRFAYLALPFLALFVFSCANATGLVFRIMSSRVCQYGGKVSYSLYMTHFFILMITNKILAANKHASDPLLERVALMTSYYLVAIGAAIFTYHFIEEPSRKWIRARHLPDWATAERAKPPVPGASSEVARHAAVGPNVPGGTRL